MFDQSFHELIRYRRRKRNLRQSLVARKIGFTRVRLSQLERGIRRPTEDEKDRLFQFYQVHPSTDSLCRPTRVLRSLMDMGRRATPAPAVYIPPRDRAARVRYLAAVRTWPVLSSRLTACIKQRKDYPIVAYFCQQLSLDSADECLYLMSRLSEGALPALLAPTKLGPVPHPIVCPKSGEQVGHRPRPCLIGNRGVEFPQVSLCTPRPYTLDFLLFTRQWEALEIDGPGHEYSFDAQRSSELRLPTTRLDRESLIARANDELGVSKAA